MSVASMVGRTLGKYRVLEKIGAGSLADVYRGIQIGLDREVAIKVLPPALATDRDMVARFKRESLATARMSHPHIITIFDSGEQEGLHYYVMERLKADSLADRLEVEQPLPVERAIKVAIDLVKALIYAHERQVAHRALTSTSVRFDSRDNAVLADFAPGESELADPREDLEAVGAIIEEMLGPKLPEEIAPVVERALDSGYATARDMLVALKSIEHQRRPGRVPSVPVVVRAPPPPFSPARTLVWLVPLLMLTVVTTVWVYRLIAGA
jgi:hypothetical protein